MPKDPLPEEVWWKMACEAMPSHTVTGVVLSRAGLDKEKHPGPWTGVLLFWCPR